MKTVAGHWPRRRKSDRRGGLKEQMRRCSIRQCRRQPLHNARRLYADVHQAFKVGYQLGRILGEPRVGIVDDAAEWRRRFLAMNLSLHQQSKLLR